MSVRKAIPEPDGMYFITITCSQWLNLIEITNGYDVVYTWFDYLKSKGHYVTGYVIMPNHIHALIGFRNTNGKSINPIRGTWNLVDDYRTYVHSSAKYYNTGEQGMYSVTSCFELEDIDLTKE